MLSDWGYGPQDFGSFPDILREGDKVKYIGPKDIPGYGAIGTLAFIPEFDLETGEQVSASVALDDGCAQWLCELEDLIRVERVSYKDPATMQCEWCKEIKLTHLHEIWSEAHPLGELKRLCENCVKQCAG